MGDTITTNEAPRFTITIAGNEFTQAETDGLEYLSVEDHVDMIGVAQFGMRIASGWDRFNIGDEVTVEVGGSDRKVFVGYITGFRHFWKKGKEQLILQAMDPLVKLSSSRVTKVYEEQSDSDIVSAVIGDAGETPGTVDSTDGTNKYVFQRNESNLNFLKRLASRNGYLLLANEGKIDFVAAQFSGSSVEIPKNEMMSLDYTFTDVHIPTDVTVIGWDYLTKEKVEASGSSVDSIGGGSAASATTWGGTAYISDVHVSTQAGATAMAEGEFNRLARTLVRGKATVQGNGAIHAGVKIALKDNAVGFNPEGYVVSARHIVESGEGFITEFHFVGNTKPS